MSFGWFVVTACSVVLSVASLIAPASAADWKPDKPIEFVVGTGPGSGVDNTARIAQSILQAQKIVEPQITISNKPGGPYAVAYNYLSQFPGDGSKLAVQTSTPLAALLTGQLTVKYFEFTPIA